MRRKILFRALIQALEAKIQAEKSQQRIERLVQAKHKLLEIRRRYPDSSEPKPD
jgi:hypothetical protein